MMDVAMFTKVNQEQVEEVCRSWSAMDWAKMVWKHTSNPRLLLIEAKAIDEIISEFKTFSDAVKSSIIHDAEIQTNYIDYLN